MFIFKGRIRFGIKIGSGINIDIPSQYYKCIFTVFAKRTAKTIKPSENVEYEIYQQEIIEILK